MKLNVKSEKEIIEAISRGKRVFYKNGTMMISAIENVRTGEKFPLAVTSIKTGCVIKDLKKHEECFYFEG